MFLTSITDCCNIFRFCYFVIFSNMKRCSFRTCVCFHFGNGSYLTGACCSRQNHHFIITSLSKHGPVPIQTMYGSIFENFERSSRLCVLSCVCFVFCLCPAFLSLLLVFVCSCLVHCAGMWFQIRRAKVPRLLSNETFICPDLNSLLFFLCPQP